MTYLAGGVAALQQGETRLSWPGLDGSVSLSVTIRTRRLDDQRVPYGVDSRLATADDQAAGELTTADPDPWRGSVIRDHCPDTGTCRQSA